jgi:hypothetical protein
MSKQSLSGEEAEGAIMNTSTTIPVPTLWDLATIVLEEVEKICKDERRAVALAREILIRIIQGHVKNMEVELPASYVVAQGGLDGPEAGPLRTSPDG